jgi:hypothetical protein
MTKKCRGFTVMMSLAAMPKKTILPTMEKAKAKTRLVQLSCNQALRLTISSSTGMNQPGFEALQYFPGKSSTVPPPKVFSMLCGLEQHVPDVDRNEKRG